MATLKEKIRQRRSQMLIHSYIYYDFDDNIVDDHTWQKWANELVELQKQEKNIGFYDKEFKGWNGSSGFDLPKDDWIREMAWKLLQDHINNDRKD